MTLFEEAGAESQSQDSPNRPPVDPTSLPEPVSNKPSLTFFKILAVIFACEMAVMVLLRVLAVEGPWAIVLDPILLASLSTPVLYRWIVTPLRDLEQRKRLEGEMRKLSQATEQSPTLVVITDTDGTIEYVNSKFTQVTGYAASEAIGRTPRIMKSGHMPAATYDELWKTITAGRDWQGELYNRKQSGELYWEFAHISPVVGDGNTITHFVKVAVDITRRKRAEAELHRSETKFRTLYDSTSDAVMLLDDRGFFDCNAATVRIFGCKDKAEFCTKHPADLSPPEQPCGTDSMTLAGRRIAVAMEKDSNRFEWVHKRLDTGKAFPAEVLLNAMELGGRRVLQAVVRDITERKRAQAKLHEAKNRAEAATRAKSEFLANMSHEIRTPMTAILGFTDILLNEIKEPEAREAAEIVKRNGEHLLELINDILDLSKIEAGKMEFEKMRVSPRQVVAEVVSLLHVRAHAKGLTLIDEYEGPLPKTIVTDPTRLQQILTNIVGNAVKFTETGGVRIVTRLAEGGSDEPKLRFDVIDTGIGIPEEQIDNVFEAFSQADGSATRQYGGTGLGLAIARQFARKLGGDVTATSEPDKGSTFTVTIATGPLRGVPFVNYARDAAPGSEEPSARATEDERELECRVLLAEDIPDNQRLIAAVLKNAGAEVAIAEDGQEALERALATQPGRGRRCSEPEAPFDVVLMDMQMPALDGYEATRRLREEGYAGPIIALTAHAMRGDRRKCLEAGCDDYLTKPIDRNKLLETVIRWLSRRQEQTATAAARECGREEINT